MKPDSAARKDDIHPLPDAGTRRQHNERRFGQTARAIWFFGLSGSGKSTLAMALDRELTRQGRVTMLLDGDNLRAGINRGLGFSDADRAENLRRAAEVARLFVNGGTIAICAFISPLRANREMVRSIVGPADFLGIYLRASFGTCARRDPKGLYAKAAAGTIRQFTGKDSGFEAPADEEAHLVIDSENLTVEAALAGILAEVGPRILPS